MSDVEGDLRIRRRSLRQAHLFQPWGNDRVVCDSRLCCWSDCGARRSGVFLSGRGFAIDHAGVNETFHAAQVSADVRTRGGVCVFKDRIVRDEDANEVMRQMEGRR